MLKRYGTMLAALVLMGSAPALADKTADEMVYRANLGRADDIRLLIKGGASAAATDSNGVPLLSLAAARKDAEALNVVRALLDAGVDINSKDQSGQTALFYAARSGNIDMVQLLMSRGISYYTPDNDNNIARTIAHNAGHDEVVQFMDHFVNEQTAQVNAQYEAANEAIKESYRLRQQSVPEKPVEVAPVVPLGDATPKPDRLPADTEVQKAEIEAVSALARDLAYNNCAFQYWSFCLDVKKSTELSASEIDSAIEGYKSKIADLHAALNDHAIQPPLVTRVENSAKTRIFNELNLMPSNIERQERGVGKKADMETRCNRVATNWQVAPEAIEQAPKSSKTSAGGIGKVSSGAKGKQKPAVQRGNPGPHPGAPAANRLQQYLQQQSGQATH